VTAQFILDGYCGAGGWDEGARLLGLGPVVGIDNWLDACHTGVAAGHGRICADVSTYPTAPFVGRVSGLVKSPPCTSFSAAGKQLGLADRANVHALVDRMAAGDDDWRQFTWADERSHHTAQPVRWVRDLRPDWVCLEQVPEVLPLWKNIGRVLTGWGYSVWVGCLNAADFGVAQTRRRAFLAASRVRRVAPPQGTHYDPTLGVALFGTPWVSMAQALGWVGIDRPARTVCGNREPRWAYGLGNSSGTGWTLVGGAQENATARGMGEPAGTVFCSRPGNLRWIPPGGDSQGGSSERLSVTVVEAAVLQSFRPDYPWRGNKTSRFAQVGNAVPPLLAAAVLSAATGVPFAQDEVRAA
jgi:DNA (cytosine-5)-methyltransferase 1